MSTPILVTGTFSNRTVFYSFLLFKVFIVCCLLFKHLLSEFFSDEIRRIQGLIRNVVILFPHPDLDFFFGFGAGLNKQTDSVDV